MTVEEELVIARTEYARRIAELGPRPSRWRPLRRRRWDRERAAVGDPPMLIDLAMRRILRACWAADARERDRFARIKRTAWVRRWVRR